ncbi:16S rRNA (guanine(966)-N(2))-methyltransferase RsmD [bacterium]|nr:16S rRNA (guanine(966)-N(2))-methyltransferase RsmD [bacterium]
MSLRVIAGRFRGRTLSVPRGQATRPTLGRVRESLLGILNPWLPGARVLDLYAGSGALGIEALSRGAQFAAFVENSHPALKALQANIAALGIAAETAVIERDAMRFLGAGAPPRDLPFDIVLLDPPYGLELADKALEKISESAGAWLSAEALVVAQAGRHDKLQERYGNLAQTRQARYGDTWVAIYKLQ